MHSAHNPRLREHLEMSVRVPMRLQGLPLLQPPRNEVAIANGSMEAPQESGGKSQRPSKPPPCFGRVWPLANEIGSAEAPPEARKMTFKPQQATAFLCPLLQWRAWVGNLGALQLRYKEKAVNPVLPLGQYRKCEAPLKEEERKAPMSPRSHGEH